MKKHKMNRASLIIRLRNGKNLSLAVRFVRSAMKKGVSEAEAIRLATGLYPVNPQNLCNRLMKLNNK